VIQRKQSEFSLPGLERHTEESFPFYLSYGKPCGELALGKNFIKIISQDKSNSLGMFLFRFLRNETVLFSVWGWTVYIEICNNPIRAKFVTVNVNTMEIQSSQQNVAFRTNYSVATLFENEELRLQLSFLDIKIPKQTTHSSDSNHGKEIHFGSKETARLRDLATTGIF